MTTSTTHGTTTTNNAGFPPAPGEAHQKTSCKGDAQSVHLSNRCLQIREVKMFNIFQMMEMNAGTYCIFKTGVSTEGDPVGTSEVIADNLEFSSARLLKTALQRAQYVGARSLLVLPCFVDDETGETIPQLSGPDISTELWCLFQRNPDGETETIDDYPSADLAYADANLLANGLGIDIEPEPWSLEMDEALHDEQG